MSRNRFSFFKQSQIAGDSSIQYQAGGDIHIHGNFEVDALKNTLRQVCDKQLSAFTLRDSDVLRNKAKRLSDIYSSHRIQTRGDEFFSNISRGFLGFDKPLTSHQQNIDISVIRNYCEKHDCKIDVTTCTWFVGTLSILSFMRDSLDIPLNINMDFAHSGQTAIDLKSQKNNKYPKISIIADGPSSYVFEKFSKDPEYIPISYAPPLEHKVVIHKEAKRWFSNKHGLSGEYHIVNYDNLISTPNLHLHQLINQRKINPKSTKVICVEPGEQLPVFLDGASDSRSIFCDPQWQVINLWHPGSFKLYDDESFWSDVIVHVEKRFEENEASASFLRLFHGCWYDMKYNLNFFLDKGINSLMTNTDFSRLLLHFCGLK